MSTISRLSGYQPVADFLLGFLQGIMLDIVVMLFSILRAYMPAEFRWSAILVTFDMYSWNICMGTILYCVFWTL